MNLYHVQNPTKRPAYWRTRPSRTIKAASEREAAVQACKDMPSGVYFVNVTEETGRSYMSVAVVRPIGGGA